MTSGTDAQSSGTVLDASHTHPRASAENPVHRTAKSQSRRASRQSEGEDRRKRKAQAPARSALSGYGDGIERAYCAHFWHELPAAFPVQHRTGLATIPPVVVDRRPSALLLCNCLHRGPHSWPNGDPVDGTEE